MPKLKTHRGAAKRFKKTGTGKVVRASAFKRHILTGKTTKSKRQKRGTYYLNYFEAPNDAVQQVRRDLTLTDGVIRFLILAWPDDASLPDKIEVKRMMTDDDAKAGLFAGEGRGRFGDRSDFGDRSGGGEDVPEEARP